MIDKGGMSRGRGADSINYEAEGTEKGKIKDGSGIKHKRWSFHGANDLERRVKLWRARMNANPLPVERIELLPLCQNNDGIHSLARLVRTRTHLSLNPQEIAEKTHVQRHTHEWS